MIRIATMFCAVIGLAVSAQDDVRLYRAPNHLIMAVHQLKADEQWEGPSYTRNGERFGVRTWGSGCVVSQDGFILTANHVVTGGDSYVVGGWPDPSPIITAEIIKRDEKNDLALIKVKPPSGLSWIAANFVESSAIREGEEVFVWAYLMTPNAFLQFLRRGMVSNNTPTPGSEQPIYVETTAAQGTSGSPVFLRNGGKPIGIVSSKLNMPGGFPLPAGILGVVPGEKINRFLHDANIPSFQGGS